jgi:hypothetical protein
MTARFTPAAVLALVVLIAAAARMPFWLASTHAYGHGDAIIWQVWSRSIHEHGFINVLRTADSNNVGYHYVLWPISAIYARISPEYELWTAPIRILMKVPPFLCDLGLTALIFSVAYRFAERLPSPKRQLAAGGAALAFGVAPASIYDSMFWTQIDSVNALTMLAAAVLLARGNVALAWAALTVGFLAKPQPIVMVPIVASFTYWRFGVAGVARGAGGALAVGALALGPFLLHGDARLIGETYDRMFEQWRLDLSQGAWNGWSILDVAGDPHTDDVVLRIGGRGVSYAALSLGLTAAATLLALTYLRRHLDLEGLLIASAAMVFTFYMVPTSTHERYLYPAFALAAPVLVRRPWLILPYGVLAATFMLNLLAINPPNASGFWEWHGTRFAVGVAALHSLLYGLMTLYLVAGSAPAGLRVPAPARRTRAAAAPAVVE